MTTPVTNTNDIALTDSTAFDVKPTKGGKLYANERVDGSIDDNISWSHGVNNKQKTALRKEFVKVTEHIADLYSKADEAEASGQTNLAASLRKEARNCESSLKVFKIQVETMGSGGAVAAQAGVHSLDLDRGKKMMAKVASIAAAVAPQGDLAIMEAAPAVVLDLYAQTTSADSPPSDFLNMDDSELLREMEADPKAFYGKLAKMSSEDRQGILLRLNQTIQTNNQTFSAISSMMKAQHDTQKAILANLRV